MKTVFFAGSFNPFTRGHQSIVERALKIFDKVIIAIGANVDKPEAFEAAQANRDAIMSLWEGDERVEVVVFNGLAAECAKSHGACALLRGVRSVADYEYERTMADVNRRISGLETVLLFTLPELADVSSSIVRELKSFGADVSDFLPAKQ